MSDPNVRVFDCGGLKVHFMIDRADDVFMGFEPGAIYGWWLDGDEKTKVKTALFPNGYTKLNELPAEQATEVNE